MPWVRRPEPHPLDDRIFEVEVRIFGDPVHMSRPRMIPKLSRTIAIHGRDTLADLHEAIFKAFDRYDEHMWEFQIGGAKPFDKISRRYVLPMAMEDDWVEPKPTAVAAQTSIASLDLKKRDIFFYWFDFGDDWWHRLDVRDIRERVKGDGRLPRVVNSVGDSPPQYPEYDEDADD